MRRRHRTVPGVHAGLVAVDAQDGLVAVRVLDVLLGALEKEKKRKSSGDGLVAVHVFFF